MNNTEQITTMQPPGSSVSNPDEIRSVLLSELDYLQRKPRPRECRETLRRRDRRIARLQGEMKRTPAVMLTDKALWEIICPISTCFASLKALPFTPGNDILGLSICSFRASSCLGV